MNHNLPTPASGEIHEAKPNHLPELRMKVKALNLWTCKRFYLRKVGRTHQCRCQLIEIVSETEEIEASPVLMHLGMNTVLTTTLDCLRAARNSIKDVPK